MTRVRAAVLLLTTALALGACGDKGELPGKGESSSTKDDDASQAASATSGPKPRAEDAAALQRLAEKYIDGLVAKDYRRVCQTRTRTERRELAQVAGSCPKAFEAIERSDSGQFELFEDASARADAVFLDGERARIPVFRPGQEEPALTLTAVRERGRYKLLDDPEE